MKVAGPNIEPDGRITYRDDPWDTTTINKFVVSPEGKIYHWWGELGHHGQSFMAMESEGQYLQKKDDDWKEEYEERFGLLTSIDYIDEGWAVGFSEPGELFFASQNYSSQIKSALSEILNTIKPEMVMLDYDGEDLEMNFEEAVSFVSEQKVASGDKAQDAIEATELISVPPNTGQDYKFVVNHEGEGVFWVPPFVAQGGGKYYGPAWDKYEDYPHHLDIMRLIRMGYRNEEGGILGYCTDGYVQCFTEDPIFKWANKLLEWFSDKEYIEWDGQEIKLEGLDWFKSADSNHSMASVRESVFSKAVKAMGFLGCFYCLSPLEKVEGDLLVSGYGSTEHLVPSCGQCQRREI